LNGSVGCGFVLNEQAFKFYGIMFTFFTGELASCRAPGAVCYPQILSLQLLELCVICHSLFKDSFDINLSWIPDDAVTGSEAANAASRDAIPHITFLHLLDMFT
jgi:hypothetical protein